MVNRAADTPLYHGLQREEALLRMEMTDRILTTMMKRGWGLYTNPDEVTHEIREQCPECIQGHGTDELDCVQRHCPRFADVLLAIFKCSTYMRGDRVRALLRDEAQYEATCERQHSAVLAYFDNPPPKDSTSSIQT